MAEKKNTKKNPPKSKVEKAPSMAERITDFSTNGVTNLKITPKKKK